MDRGGTGGSGRGGGTGRGRRAAAGLAALLAASLARAAAAQLELDGSLGSAGPVPFDAATTTWEITDDLGLRSGGSLYHSFSLFDVGAGETASFHLLDPASPEPDLVIARVTGGDRSEILGRVQSRHDGADLFLINPSGFSFGPGSAVDALGSVYLSSSDVLRFGDGAVFDARSAEPPALLSAEPPSAFGFLGAAPASIRFDLDTASSSASDFDSPVLPGETLAAVGGEIVVRDSEAARGPTIRIDGGTLALASVASGGIDVPVDVAGFDARGFAAGALGEVTVARNAAIDVRNQANPSVGAGRVVIRAGRLVVDDASVASVSASALAGHPLAIDFETSESVAIRGDSRLAVTSVTAPAGDIRIASTSVEIEGARTSLASTARGAGEAPDIALEADALAIEAGAQVTLTAQPAATVPGGRLAVRAGSASVADGAIVLGRSQGAAPGGALSFDVGTLHVSGSGVVKSETAGSGAGGAIEIAARSVRVESQGQIASENTASGPGGAISVRAEEEVWLASRGRIASAATGAASAAGGDVEVRAGGRILVVGEDATDRDVTQISALTSSTAPAGRGGSLRASAPLIELRDGGQLRTTAEGAAPGGSLEIVETGLLRAVGNATVDGERAGAGLFARVAPGASGVGGSLQISARSVAIEDGAEVSTRTLGTGDAGDLVIRDAARVAVRGGPRGEATLSTRGAQGAGGDLVIDLASAGGELELASGGIVSASTLGAAPGGEVRVAAERVAISGASSGLFSQSLQAQGAAGEVLVEVGRWLEVRDGGRISVNSEAGGAAGDVAIRGGPGATLALVGGHVTARSRGGSAAGNVTIETGGDFVAGAGASVATDARGNVSGGRVSISAAGILYASDARIETLVDSGLAGGRGDGGDVDAPPVGTALPGFAVLNRSRIVASAIDGNGGNIQVAADELLASQGVVIDATSRRGVSGIVEITSPDADLAGQITPLPANFYDASRLMTTPCEARRARAGSFVVQTRPAIEPLPDAPLPPSLLPGAGADASGSGAAVDPGCRG
jgi:filamentous hemagglutinin family protein